MINFSLEMEKGRELFRRGFSIREVIMLTDEQVRNARFMGYFEAEGFSRRDFLAEVQEQEEYAKSTLDFG